MAGVGQHDRLDPAIEEIMSGLVLEAAGFV